MKKLLSFVAIALSVLSVKAQAFNLWQDIEQNTQWTLGNTASAGTAINLRSGDLSASALASISSYRMVSIWYGGTLINGNMTDTLKVGLNLSYFLKDFTNQPPDLIKNLVIGPSFAMSVISTPRVGTPFIDLNYKFGQ